MGLNVRQTLLGRWVLSHAEVTQSLSVTVRMCKAIPLEVTLIANLNASKGTEIRYHWVFGWCLSGYPCALKIF